MDLGQKISCRKSTEVSELEVGVAHPQQEWQEREEEATEHDAIITIAGG